METQPSSALPKWTTKNIVQATLFVILVGAAFWLLIRFRTVFFVLFIAIVISTAIKPAVGYMYRVKIPRAAGVLLIYLILSVLLIGFILAIAPIATAQSAEIADNFPGYYREARAWLLGSPSLLIRRIGMELPSDISLGLAAEVVAEEPPGAEAGPEEGEVPPPGEQENGIALSQVEQMFHYFNLTVRALFLALAIFLLAFYWTLDGDRSIRSLLLFIPKSRRDSVREIVDEIQDRVGLYVRGVFILSLSIGTLSLVAYVIIGVPYALLLAIVAGVMEAVPIIGPTLGAIPAILVLLQFDQTVKVIWVLLATVIIQAIENTFLVPRVMDRSVGVSPIVTLLALAAFSSLLGIAGALLAIPIAAVVQLFVNRFLLKPGALEEPVPVGRDRYSALRMQLQELTLDVRRQLQEKSNDTTEQSDRVEDRIEEIANELDHILTETQEQRNNG